MMSITPAIAEPGSCSQDAAVRFDDLPCMAMIERAGFVVARNALARRMTGFGDGDETRLDAVLMGAFELAEDEQRWRFDCLLLRRHGQPMAVHGVARKVTYDGVQSRMLLLVESKTESESKTDSERWAGSAGEEDREGSLVESVLNAAPEASVITHDNRVLYVNGEFTRLFGYAATECVGRDLDELVVPEGRDHENEMFRHTLQQNGRVALETRRRTRTGEEVDVCVLIGKVRLGRDATGTLVTYRDIGRQKREEARLKHNARHDVLTGLANRALFLEEVALTLARLRRRPDRRFAVIFLDLDGFKQVNDSLGHAAGDALLLEVADRLTRCLRPQDTVARFGGDEFALLLDESGSEVEVDAVAARIQAEVQMPFRVKGVDARVSASMGVAIAAPGYAAADEILHHADLAMYNAKSAGGARHVTYRRQAAVLGFVHGTEESCGEEERSEEGGCNQDARRGTTHQGSAKV